MTKKDLIFSNKLLHRISRHLLFWLVFGVLTTIQSFGDPLAGFISPGSIQRALWSTFFYSPFIILSVYVFTGIFFTLLKKKKYAKVVSGFILLTALGVWIDYHATVIYLRTASANELSFEQNILVGNNLVWYSLIIGALALGIKLAKNWYQQKNENLLLAKQKANTELKLLKARIHPGFLFKTLDIIYKESNNASNQSPLLILKLSDILSYQLYESEAELVPLEKEINAVKNFVEISNLITAESQMVLKIIGDPENKFIMPLLLLTFIHHILPVINSNEDPCIIISFETTDLTLVLLLHNVEESNAVVKKSKEIFVSEETRINRFYENNCHTGWSYSGKNVELSLRISLKETRDRNVNLINREVYESA